MRLSAQELEQMKSVDIGAVAAESLPDVSGMASVSYTHLTLPTNSLV